MDDVPIIIADVVGNVTNLVLNIIDDGEHNQEIAFTQQTCQRLLERCPQMNVMVVHSSGGGFTENFVNATHHFVELPLAIGTEGYDIYVFTSGDFTLNGDGGFVNWCFGSNYVRNGNHVVFNKIAKQAPPPPPPPPPPALPTPIPPYPQPNGMDGVFLVNSFNSNNSESSSGFAWYSNSNNAQGIYPGAYINIDTSGNIHWEGVTTSGVFDDGDNFSVSVDADAAGLPPGSTCGSAANKYRQMTVYKDNYRELYNVDGWTVYTVYFCT